MAQDRTVRLERIATATIAWASFSNEDNGEAEPDSGWYVSLTEQATGRTHDIGPDVLYKPGLATIDEAMAEVEKWAHGRGLTVPRDGIILNLAVIRDPASVAPPFTVVRARPLGER